MVNEKSIKFLTPEQVCEILQIGRQKCKDMFNSRDFPSINIFGSLRVKEDTFNDFLSSKRCFTR